MSHLTKTWWSISQAFCKQILFKTDQYCKLIVMKADFSRPLKWARAIQNHYNDVFSFTGYMCPAKTQISLGLRSLISLHCPHAKSLGPQSILQKLIRCPGWLESLLGALAVLLVLSCSSSCNILIICCFVFGIYMYVSYYVKKRCLQMRQAMRKCVLCHMQSDQRLCYSLLSIISLDSTAETSRL